MRGNITKEMQKIIDKKLFKSHKVCRKCGYKNPLGASHCRHCGYSKGERGNSRAWYRDKAKEPRA